MKPPFIIGIAGPSGSGKTVVAQALETLIGNERCASLSLDNYYKDLSHISLEERQALNFDLPSAWDEKLLAAHCAQLAAGKAIRAPIYDFDQHNRKKQTQRLEPKAFLILEGVFALALESARRYFNYKAYVDADWETCLERRLERDSTKRGRSAASIREQFMRDTLPSISESIAPSKAWADIKLDGLCEPELSATRIYAALQARGAIDE